MDIKDSEFDLVFHDGHPVMAMEWKFKQGLVAKYTAQMNKTKEYANKSYEFERKISHLLRMARNIFQHVDKYVDMVGNSMEAAYTVIFSSMSCFHIYNFMIARKLADDDRVKEYFSGKGPGALPSTRE
ncbi:hypothetical protein A2U01_0040274, partial [Trifolium medium]|nr:hypothetical protein [Trifolium medium]